MKNRFFILTAVGVVAMLLLAFFLFPAESAGNCVSTVTLKPVSGHSLSLEIGQETDISVIYSENADVLRWISHHPSVVSITGNGKDARLVAHTAGTAVLEVTDGYYHSNILVTVTDPNASADALPIIPACRRVTLAKVPGTPIELPKALCYNKTNPITEKGYLS